MRWILVEVPIRVYRWLVSPAIHLLAGTGFGCRFHPTCGAYAEECLRRHGPFHGLLLAVRRVARCHPWQAGGWDPVPPARGINCSGGS